MLNKSTGWAFLIWKKQTEFQSTSSADLFAVKGTTDDMEKYRSLNEGLRFKVDRVKNQLARVAEKFDEFGKTSKEELKAAEW